MSVTYGTFDEIIYLNRIHRKTTRKGGAKETKGNRQVKN